MEAVMHDFETKRAQAVEKIFKQRAIYSDWTKANRKGRQGVAPSSS